MGYKTSQCLRWSPSPLNGERAGVRGENADNALILQALGERRSPSPHPTLSPPSGSGEGMPAFACSLSRCPSSKAWQTYGYDGFHVSFMNTETTNPMKG